MIYFKVLYQYLGRETEESHQNFCKLRIKPGLPKHKTTRPVDPSKGIQLT